MKKTIVSLCLLIGTAFYGFSQLAMPDAATTPSSNDSVAVQEAEKTVQSRYYTPSKSYKTERNDIRRGNALFKEDKFYEALEAYDEALKENGSSIRARFNKAVTLLQLQNDDNKGTSADPRVQAQKLFGDLISDAMQFDKDIAEKAYYNLGNMAFNDEQYDQSIECYKSALRIDPNNMQTRENLRLAQLKKQEQEQNQDQQDQQQEDQQQQQQQEQQDQQDQQQDQQEQQPQPQDQKPMTNSAQQILQTMQNKENATRKKVQAKEEPATGRPQPEKPW